MSGQPADTPPAAAYEQADIRPGPVLAAVLAMLLVLVAVLALLSPWRHGAPVPPPPAQTGAALLPDPSAALARFRARKAARLGGYGWVDEPAGVAHIPVERAIELLLEPDAAPAGVQEAEQ
ncbi:MAG: hypothetical protein PVG72_11820 [Gammaproteobacteria bacterium]